jgi:hypothetical protein
MYFQWNRRGQRSAVETLEADHGAWINARVDGTGLQRSRKLATAIASTDNRSVDLACVCEVCHAHVSELRRGRCWGCYERWVETRPVGLGARCVTCTEKRRRFLKTVELFGHWRPMCFNCHGVMGFLEPMPRTIVELRDAVSRERRKRDRRWGKPDTRVFVYERRVGERRGDREELPLVDDEMIIEVSIDESDSGLEFEDITAIRELITELRPAELAG